ncbi:ubiquinone/menaquinone biosynthesis methyltransferase [Streptomyces spectabilis]|uniref:Demethylmenaquinone methyltransferase n=1 Tax=Streptomyces spectabilis TaxID=68270 RepID=A0A7W8B5W1_STRST|nr:ubiquinone/menaquinone biosynthesis methyltransferase [Streptomyces spectabilis]MBB5109760.1 demethylmenaquinone methyltransferase/2-methoxy-6-polyprenyl-1,4-benzoquinol methylase [Streptomyces spectabilis]GGV55433.1 demethylmenaquinone methyltransferase [Streptomyces spectabilis]
MTRARLDKDPRQVSTMFDQVARGYDRTRAVLWLGQMGRWGRITQTALELRTGQKVLDVACGTGTSSRCLAASGADVTGCDFSPGMLAVARSRVPGIAFVPGDALCLPFSSGSFDAVSISFGLRNVADPHGALTEMLRVVRPGGRLTVCEFSRPKNRTARVIAARYLKSVVPVVARRLSTNAQGYDYLAESIAAWPDQPALAQIIQAAGWADVAWLDLCSGFVAVHRGVRR